MAYAAKVGQVCQPVIQASIAALHLDLQTTENLCSSFRPLKDPEERDSVILKEHPFRAGLSLEQPHSWNDPASARHCHSHQQPVLLSPSRLPLCALMSSGHTPSSSLVLPSVHSAGTSQGVPHIWRGTLAPACLHAPPPFRPAFLDVIHGDDPSGDPVLSFPVQFFQGLTRRSLE